MEQLLRGVRQILLSSKSQFMVTNAFMEILSNFLVQFLSEPINQKCSGNKLLFKNFVEFTREHLCQKLFSIKVARLQLYQEVTVTQMFSVNFAKFFRTDVLQNTYESLFLYSLEHLQATPCCHFQELKQNSKKLLCIKFMM